jgi:hypothetical protein
MGIVIFYKNAARVGSYIQCGVNLMMDANECSAFTAHDAIADNRLYDCILPHGISLTSNVIVCKLSVKVCDEFGSPKSDAIENVSPDLYMRTDRGAWNVYNKNCRFLIPIEGNFSIQLCTKERSNVMKAALILDFVDDKTANSVAHSDILLVLSKPPRQASLPFARVVSKAVADEDGLVGRQCSPSRWLSGIQDEKVIVPEGSTDMVAPWNIRALGSYRSAAAEPPKQKEDEMQQKKRKRIDQDVPKIDVEVEALQNQVLELQSRLKALENERDGLAKALRQLK